MQPYLIDRSRIIRYFQCPRAYFWAYVYGDKGLAPTRRPVPLAIGGAVHKGLENLLRGASEDAAVDEARALFRKELADGGLSLGPDEAVLFVYREQELLVEALVRVYARRGLPRLLRDYEIIEVEQEVDLPLSDGLTFMSRADGLLRKRTDGGLYVLSFKTARRYDKRLSADGSHDVQGLSECAALQQKFDERIIGVQMDYLIKGGREEWPKGSGNFIQNTPLLHPWYNGKEWAWSYRWRDASGGHALQKGYGRVNVWEYMSVSEWVSLLDSGRVQPEAGDCLDGVLVYPYPYLRRVEEIKDWVEQTAAVGARIHRDSAEIGPCATKTRLNTLFPQNRRACDWPSPCSFQSLCFGPVADDPVGSGLFTERRAHHDTEIERFEGDED